MDIFFQIITIALIFIFVIALTYFVTKMIAKAKQNTLQNSNIKIIESIYLSQKKTLQLVKVADRVFLLANYKEGIELIAEFEEDKINLKEKEFKSYMDFFMRGKSKDDKNN